MPELPEVETVRNTLKKSILGLTITGVNIFYENIIVGCADDFIKNTINKTIKDILRYGKFLIFVLNDGNILCHLRMEGKLFYEPKGKIENKHIHVVFDLSNGYTLSFQDVRKFGRMIYKDNNDLYTTTPLKDLGEDLILNENIKAEEILKILNRKNIPIKTALLDQSILCGLGNIYVDEVLFQSHILPNRSCKTITLMDVSNILLASRQILSKAIEQKGTTIRSYTSSLGVIGGYQNYLQVHTKTICPICNNKINKMKIGGRTSYFCNHCQR